MRNPELLVERRRELPGLAFLLLAVALACTCNLAGAQALLRVPQDFATIQAAIDASANGDTVLVAAGTYVENINFRGKAITLKSESGPNATIIDGSGRAPVVTFSAGEGPSSVISGFTLRGGNGDLSPNGGPSWLLGGGGIAINFASPTVTGNIIAGNRSCTGGGIAIISGSPLLERNIVAGNALAGCYGGVGGGILIFGRSDAQILGNVISGNTSTTSDGGGIIVSAGTTLIRGNIITGNSAAGGGGGIYTGSSPEPLIIQNVIARNRANSGGGISSGGPLVLNNTIVDNDSDQASGIFTRGYGGESALVNNIIVARPGQTAVYCGGQAAPDFRFNDVFAPSGSAFRWLCTNVIGTQGNISANPLFVDQVRGDYRLQSSSPAINAGTNTAPGLPATDIAGNPRVAGGGENGVVDMGAYEFSAFPPPVTLAPARSDLGTILVGSPALPRIVTLANSGPTEISVSLIAVAASDTAAFAVAPAGPNPCASLSPTIAAGASCTLALRFSPDSAGFKTGELVVMSDAVELPALATFTATVLDVDTTPDFFSFEPQRDPVPRNSVVMSNPITVSGINTPVAISITGGEYSIDGGAYTAAPGLIANGQQVTVRITASPSYGTSSVATLTMGDRNASFVVMTLPTFSMAPYLPLAIGNRWNTVDSNGTVGYSDTVTGTKLVNGVITSVLSSLDGSELYMTNDDLGIRIHGAYNPPDSIPGCGTVSETDIFSPPIIMAPASLSLLQPTGTNGTVTVDLGACGTNSLTYVAQAEPWALEMVTVAAGKFEALRLMLFMRIYGPNGVAAGEMTHWLAPGIGFVKQMDNAGAITELQSTNVVRTNPDAIQFTPQTGVPLNGLVESNAVTVTGITSAAPVSIAGGEYSVNGGAYRSTAGTVANGDTIKVRLASPAAGNTTSSAMLAVGGVSAAFSTTTSKAWSLVQGWNLLGNGTSGVLDVAAAFGDAAKVTSVWKWIPGTMKWAFYSPTLSATELSVFAGTKGYDVLATVGGGEGFWVNAKTSFSAQSPPGTPIASTSLYSTNSGWSLIAIGDNKTPLQLNAAIGDLTTLWAWDTASSAWYFYAPSLQAQSGTALADYIASKGYRDFAADNKTLDPWTGFWVNRP